MRRSLALVSAAVTSMVAIAFLIPLAIMVRDVARNRAFTSAQLTGTAVEPVLAVTTDRATLERAIASTAAGRENQLAIDLNGTLIGGPQRVGAADLRAISNTTIVPVTGGYEVLEPDAGAIIEVYVPAADVTRGVTASWAVMTAVALALIGVSVIVADRLASRITRPARALAAAAAALGEGDLTARSTPAGPPELAATGHAFNLMAERLSGLISAERVMAADLPHRLRTPLTALRMNAASLGPGRAADETRLAVQRMEREIDLIIRAARRPAPEEPSGCDAAEVLTERMAFWSALAEDQGRPWHLTGADRPVRVPVSRSDLATAADALLGNVFQYTPEGTEFAVTLHAGRGVVLIFFADAGPGISDPGAALQRGISGGGSTGLGLDIARRVAGSTGGTVKIDRSALGGAQVQLWLRVPDLNLKRTLSPSTRADAVVSVTRMPRFRVVLLGIGPLATAVVIDFFAHNDGPESLRRTASSSAALAASFQTVSSWDTGYCGRYTITNAGTAAVSGWILAVTLPSGTSVSSLWDGSYADNGGRVTVKNEGWDASLAPRSSVSVGFVTRGTGQPSACTINGVSCQAGGSVTAGGPAPGAQPPGAQPPAASSASFAPYVNTSLYPPFNLVSTARAAGVKQFNLAFVVSGDTAAPNPGGMMGTYAIDAATATDAQVAGILGISDDAAWSKIAVPPMIGVHDTGDEIFTVANARQLAAFAATKHLAWLSMWSAARDQECPGGVQPAAEPTCSSMVQTPDAFMDALGAY
jgi:signal transduction histidine kinase